MRKGLPTCGQTYLLPSWDYSTEIKTTGDAKQNWAALLSGMVLTIPA
jgi:hypothetical protein